MAYVVLARKWRPQRFSDLVGQEPITRTLQNAIKLGRLSHAIVLTGSRGVGKTTTARILAKALNCEKGPTVEPCGECSNCQEIAAGTNVDVREIDGASNALVEDVRELIENVRYTPAKSRHKIYIIDEVHMLSKSAFNALLKTLEEPPPGVIFLFATTEPQKIPDTILSRCQRFDFRQISEEQVVRHLRKVVDTEKITIEDVSLALLARQAGGSLRDALSLLDQVIAFSGEKVSAEEVVSILGLTERSLIAQTLEAFVRHDPKAALETFSQVWERGYDLKNYVLELWERTRDLLLVRGGVAEGLVRVTADERKRLEEWAKDVSDAELERWFALLRSAAQDLGRSEFPRYLVEVTFLKVTREEIRMPLRALVERLEKLESGAPVTTSTTPRQTVSEPVARTPAPASPVAAASTTPGTPGRSDSLEWNILLDALKRRKPSWAAILLQTTGSNVGVGKISLGFEEGSFYVSRASDPDFQAFLKATASELFGGDFSVEIRTEKKSAEKSTAAASTNRAREKEALEHPSVQRAVSLFEARVEEVKPIK